MFCEICLDCIGEEVPVVEGSSICELCTEVSEEEYERLEEEAYFDPSVSSQGAYEAREKELWNDHLGRIGRPQNYPGPIPA